MFGLKNLCLICGQPSDSDFNPCRNCFTQIKFWDSLEHCHHCSRDLAGVQGPCPDCRESVGMVLDGLISLGPWMGPLRDWLSMFKYGGDSRMSWWLADQLYNAWKENYRGITMVPVPPRRGKIHHEGRCTVDMLACNLQKHGVPVCRLLVRHDRKAQKRLNRVQRLSGQRLNYSLKDSQRINGTFVLLDDVVSTGATLSRCSDVLKEAGAENVFGLVICSN